jgi:dihydrodipicolinate synthase/N-acetylneuraminate lyase
VLRGALAAAVTPLRDGGEALDEAAIYPYVEFLAGAGLDGLFVLGTTGEGILLGDEERRRVAGRFVEAAAGRLAVVVHCGAQTTAETARLAEHAAGLGADGVAVIPPPYYAFDEHAIAAHFVAAARACEPTPFYLYEFAARSGYAVPLPVVERVRAEAPNVAGLKVSDAPWEKVAPYLVEGLDVFVGAEALVPAGLAAGAAGSVSGLASAFPEPVVEMVREPEGPAAAQVVELRASLERFPFVPAAKRALGRRGVPVREDVRGPLRRLTRDEAAEIDRTVDEWLESQLRAPAPTSPSARSHGGDHVSPPDPLLAAGGSSRFPQIPSTAPTPPDASE